ncbi:MAG: B12-binding domain-containing radical SAM protein [Candidatus Cloacimonetes bacterium]|nr:B12-binding domain-containing radical SAM protein [Candidatus Cloacimonadota bacterium]
MKVLLVVCPAWGVEMPPLGAAMLKAALIHSEIPCTVFDANQFVWKNTGSEHHWLWDKSEMHHWGNEDLYQNTHSLVLKPLWNKIIRRILDEKADIVGFTLWDSNIHTANLLMQEIKSSAPNTILLSGGPQTTFKEMRVKIDPVCDYCFVGEGEEALPEFVDFLKQSQRPLPNGFYLMNQDLHRDLPFRQVQNLLSLPAPDFSDVSYLQYATSAMPVIATRSCIFQCRFCSDYPSMGTFRKLSSPALYNILSELYRQGIRELWFNDLLINGIISELLEAFLSLEKQSRKMGWIALATPNAQLRSEDLKTLKRLGLKTLNLGLESGSEKVMRLMKKGFNKKAATDGLKRIHEAGINTQLNIIVGFPGETHEDFLETLNFLEKNKPYISGFTSVNACILIPGSEIHTKRQELGLKLGNQRQPESWYLGEENTPEIRNERLKMMLEWIHSHGYSIYASNRHTVFMTQNT